MKHKISAILLSGGQGRRFGNRDKGLVPWRGKPLLLHVLERLQVQCDQIIISCNRHVETYRQYGFETVTDDDNDYRGPLSGIKAAQRAVRYPWCLICASDMPLIPSNLVQRLLIPALDNNWQICYPVTADRQHYLPALVRSDILARSAQSLDMGTDSLHGWYAQFSTGCVDFSEIADSLVNINTQESLDSLE